MRISVLFLGGLPLLAAGATTSTTKTRVWIPPLPTANGENLFASIIDADESTTQFLLACAPTFKSPYNCNGRFQGVTLTHAANTMKIDYPSSTFDCARSPTASCARTTGAERAVATTNIETIESLRWFTEITIVDGLDKQNGNHRRTSSANAPASTNTQTADDGLCKRADPANAATKPKGKNGSDCSAASGPLGVKLRWLLVAVGTGLFGLALA